MLEEAMRFQQAAKGVVNEDAQQAEGVTMDYVVTESGADPEDTLPVDYEPERIRAFYGRRPAAVATRVSQIAYQASGFGLSLVLDAIRGQLEDSSVRRAEELRNLIVRLGPFFIKAGQALSIRPDILGPETMVELQQLCDKVPSFDSAIAFQTTCSELGVGSVNEVFSKITPEPVAAASLGQVYKATLRESGEEVAVKVQRPYMLETVSLDLYLVREVANILSTVFRSSLGESITKLLDEFAYRFYDELDYQKECANGIRMEEAMRSVPGVKIPKNYPSLCKRKVHVAEWVEGEKLSQSQADDIGRLVNLGVIAYCTQLLEVGFLHADPHPGNMLRSPEGELVILDFGLVTEVTDEQKFGMIDAIVHLIRRDYSLIGDDFKNLGFISPEVDVDPIIPVLSRVFDQALAGGGARSINFNLLAADLAEITYKYPFSIPPYFALIIRAISILEGIALVGNPKFAIIDEAFPYIARRMLTDPTPRLQESLRYMIYGQSGSEALDADRVVELLDAFEKFQTVQDAYMGDGNSDNDAVRGALQFAFSPDGRLLRNFLVEEVVNSVDIVLRDAVHRSAEAQPSLPTPNALFRGLVPALAPAVKDADRQKLETQQQILGYLTGGPLDADASVDFLASLASPEAREKLQKFAPLLAENREELQLFAFQVTQRLVERQAKRSFSWLSERIDGPVPAEA
jgi:aarF domain-containing kinase